MDISDRIRRSLITVRAMFLARGYRDVQGPIKKTLNKLNIIELCALYSNPRTDTIETIQCVWIPFNSLKLSSSVGKQDIETYCANAAENMHFIIITDSISFQAVNFLTEQRAYWEVLSYNDTACAKNNHSYVPTYSIQSKEQVLLLEAKYGPKASFNKMVCKVDAMARFLDLREGDVVRASKISCIGGNNECFRLLVNREDIV